MIPTGYHKKIIIIIIIIIIIKILTHQVWHWVKPDHHPIHHGLYHSLISPFSRGTSLLPFSQNPNPHSSHFSMKSLLSYEWNMWHSTKGISSLWMNYVAIYTSLSSIWMNYPVVDTCICIYFLYSIESWGKNPYRKWIL